MLKGDVLAYYTDPSDLYFPRNRINLSRAIAASVLEQKEKNKEATEFVVETEKRTYKFMADSAVSALEWVRCIQKVIFRTHNEGNSVKICLPIDNVLDVEENPLLDFAETIKIRVIDNDETYAVDEVKQLSTRLCDKAPANWFLVLFFIFPLRP
jgi:sterol 3beta-glucosyltransferase